MEDKRSSKTGSSEPAHAASDSSSAPGSETGRPDAAERTIAASEEPTASAAAAQEEEVTGERFHAEVSALYHKAREGFLEGVHRFITAAVLILTSSAVYALAEQTKTAPWLALGAAALTALDMAGGFGMRAKDHAMFACRFLDLIADGITERDTPQHLSARFHVLCGEEPPTFHVVQELAYNQACSARGNHDEIKVIPRRHQLVRHLFRFEAAQYPTRKEKVEQEKTK